MPPALEVLLTFLRLGLTSFGGPTAHLGYFRAELVARRRWVDDAGYLHIVALCGLLPGPTSSQVGFALGWRRAGWPGALAAFMGFTLPSAVMLAAAAAVPAAVPSGVVHALCVLAVAVVAGAVWAMARALPREAWRYVAAGAGMAMATVAPAAIATSGAVVVGVILGAVGGGRAPAGPAGQGSPRGGSVSLAVMLTALFVTGFLGSRLLTPTTPLGQLAAALYTSGALVFGGGHVVLPLLHDTLVTPGLVAEGELLAGYGLAQAMPGPLFSVAAYLGMGAGGIPGAALGTLAIFAPGLLLVGPAVVTGDRLARHPRVGVALQGAAAAVVGVLAAAAFDLARRELFGSWFDVAAAGTYVLLLGPGRRPPWQVVLLAAGVGWISEVLASA